MTGNSTAHSKDWGAEELLFLPLGGSGEIGMNLNLYGYGGKWLMVDLGVSFGDDSMPGVDVFMADPRFIEERREDLVGIVLTHGHEDHLGAVHHLWPRLRCPVYATPFTAALLRRKLAEAGLGSAVELIELPLSSRFQIGPFDLEFISLTHSIPEPNALAIRTGLGTVLHTGDWKIDPEPLVGAKLDEAALREIGAEGVLAMVCDSTNAMQEGEAGSEARVRETLMQISQDYENRIIATCFASNVARLATLFSVAEALNRHPVLVGRSVKKMTEIALETGYLSDLPPIVSEREMTNLPRNRVFVICTGSQGEPRAALSRIVSGGLPHVSLDAGDVVIFSSRVIPGNERAIGRLQNALIRQGIAVVTERDHAVHVSGHPARDELTQFYDWVRPQIAIPVHGETRHMAAHADLARDCQVPLSQQVENGTLVRLAPGPAEIVEHVHHGRLAVEGNRLVDVSGGLLQERRRVINHGSAVVSIVLDKDGTLLADPQVTIQGVLDSDQDQNLPSEVIEAVSLAIESLEDNDVLSDPPVETAARHALRRKLFDCIGKRPVTSVHIIRVKND